MREGSCTTREPLVAAKRLVAGAELAGFRHDRSSKEALKGSATLRCARTPTCVSMHISKIGKQSKKAILGFELNLLALVVSPIFGRFRFAPVRSKEVQLSYKSLDTNPLGMGGSKTSWLALD